MAKSDQKKSAALEALIDSRTLTEAAEKAGISRKTMYNYIRHDIDFAVSFRQMTEETATAAAEAVEARAARAAATIEEIMTDQDQPPMIRLKAAEMILEESDRKRSRVVSIAENNCTALAFQAPW